MLLRSGVLLALELEFRLVTMLVGEDTVDAVEISGVIVLIFFLLFRLRVARHLVRLG